MTGTAPRTAPAPAGPLLPEDSRDRVGAALLVDHAAGGAADPDGPDHGAVHADGRPARQDEITGNVRQGG